MNTTFTVTPHLRWLMQERGQSGQGAVLTPYPGAGHTFTLQQLWQGDNGTQKWRDVPIETEQVPAQLYTEYPK